MSKRGACYWWSASLVELLRLNSGRFRLCRAYWFGIERCEFGPHVNVGLVRSTQCHRVAEAGGRTREYDQGYLSKRYFFERFYWKGIHPGSLRQNRRMADL